MKGIAPWVQDHWDWRAAGNFILGGTGTGLLFFAALALAEGVPMLVTGVLSVVLVSAGLSLVWTELGRPWRFINVFFHPHTSWMTRESIIGMPLVVVGLAAAWFQRVDLAGFAALLGLCFLYCQARMLQAAKGIPAWREPLAVLLMVITGLTEGEGLFLLVAPALEVRTGVIAHLGGPSLLVLIVLRMWVWAAYRQRLEDGRAPMAALAVLREMNPWLTALGHVAPVLLICMGFLFPQGAALFFALAGLCAVGGGWYLKFSLVTRAAYNQGFALAHTPARGGKSGPGTAPGWR